jgi:hypothetical protein
VGDNMSWLLATYTIKEVGWKIVGKVILVTSISLIIGELLGLSDMNLIYQIIAGALVVLGVSSMWFFMTKIVPEQ